MPKCVRPLNMLVVEDEALLAMDIETMIEDAGHHVVGEAASLREVRELRLDSEPDIAFVDMNLAENSSGVDVCAYILKTWVDTAIVFVTANPKMLPKDLHGAHGVIAKPFSRVGLLSAMRYIEQGVCDPPPVLSLPSSFQTSPEYTRRWAPRA